MNLLTDEVRAWIGRSLEFMGDVVTEGEIRRFVAASGDPNPAYAEADADGLRLAPPMLYYGVTRPFVAAAALADDGTVHEHRPMVGQGQTMGGSVEITWKRPLREGDRLRGIRTLAALEEKRGSKLHFVLATWVTTYTDEAGDEVVRETYEQILF